MSQELLSMLLHRMTKDETYPPKVFSASNPPQGMPICISNEIHSDHCRVVVDRSLLEEICHKEYATYKNDTNPTEEAVASAIELLIELAQKHCPNEGDRIV